MFRRRGISKLSDAGTAPSIISPHQRKKRNEDKICSPLNIVLTAIALSLALYYHFALTILAEPNKNSNLRQAQQQKLTNDIAVPADFSISKTPPLGKPSTASVTSISITTYPTISSVTPHLTGKTNVASHKKASQSSTDWSAPASRAIDGSRSQQWDSASITATKKECSPWWQVDLGGIYKIENVVIFNRMDCCTDRLRNFHVEVLEEAGGGSDKVVEDLKFSGVAEGVVEASFGTGVKGRAVRVSLETCEVLSLAEVEVYGSPAL